MSLPRISILLPCRDAAATLPATIASLEAQTFGDFEVLAVDDGSTDHTLLHLDSWRRRDARVRVLRTKARGLVHALALALEGARGELIARMDADDVAEPGRLARQLELLDARPDIAVCGTRVRCFPRAAMRGGARRYESWLNALVEPDELARDIFVECPVAHPSLLARRETLRAVGGYRDAGWPEDYDLVLRLWGAGHRLANVPEVLIHWRERPDSMSRTHPRYSADAFRCCKVHHLKRTLLNPTWRGADGRGHACQIDGAVQAQAGTATGGHARAPAGPRPVVVWGAGAVGKYFARELIAQGIGIAAFVDLDPRKLGQQIHGARVVSPTEIDRFRGAFALAAVGSPGARAEIRAALEAQNWKELQDFCVVA